MMNTRDSSVEQDNDRYKPRREKNSKKHKHHDRERGDHGVEKRRHHHKKDGHKHRVDLSPEGDDTYGSNRSVFKDYGHGQVVGRVETRPSKKSRRDKHVMYDNGNQENCWGEAAEDWDAEAKGRDDNMETEEPSKPEPISYQARHGRYESVYESVAMPKHNVILPPEPRYPQKYEPVYQVDERLQNDVNLYELPHYQRKPERKQYRVGQQFSQFSGYDSPLGGGNRNYNAYPPTNAYPRYPSVKEEPTYSWDDNSNMDYKCAPISETKIHYDYKPSTPSSIKYEPIVVLPPKLSPVVKDLEKEDGECSDSEEESFEAFIGEDPFS